MLSYDLQAGNYLRALKKNPVRFQRIHQQVADCILQGIGPRFRRPFSILEIGVGDGTTLRGVLEILGSQVKQGYGFDLSWSRVSVARTWTRPLAPRVRLFVASLFQIPLPDNSVDIVYSHHSLEPNGGREQDALGECLRVARHRLILVEPCYEKASRKARNRMKFHGYVKNLAGHARRLGANVIRHDLLPWQRNPNNPSGVLILSKNKRKSHKFKKTLLLCPITKTILKKRGSFYWAPKSKLAYPIFEGIPLLRPENAIIATKR